MKIQSSILQIRTPYFTFNYSTDSFSLSFDVSKSKLEQVVFELTFCTKDYMLMGEDS